MLLKMQNVKKILLPFVLVVIMIAINKNVEGGSLEDLVSNQIFNYYLYNISHDNSTTPVEGTLVGASPFNTSRCRFNTSGCYDDDGDSSRYVNFTIDKDLNATANLSVTNLSIFYCGFVTNVHTFRSVLYTLDSTSTAGIFIYITNSEYHIDAGFGNGQLASLKASTSDISLESQNENHCMTILIDSTNRNVSLFFNNTFKVNQSSSAAGESSSLAKELIIGHQPGTASRDFTGQLQLLSIYNLTLNESLRNFIWNNGNPFIITSSTLVDSISLNNPKNNNQTHNRTIMFDFTINDAVDDKINYTLWADTNSTPDTNINQTLNVSEGTFIFNYTFGVEINGSINGTYYWKVNGTDNKSNNFQSSIFTFNITNNISLYNVTNVSITPLPLEPNNIAKCHFNITTKQGQESDTISISDYRWWLNNTLVAEAGNVSLSAGNVTNNANITCEARINNGYGQTAWTKYVNSSSVTVGDSTPPRIWGNSTQGKTSFTTSETVNITVNVTDAAGIVDSVRVIINRTGTSTITNDTMIKLDGNLYQFAQTYAVDTFKIVSFWARDSSQNVGITESALNFTVTSPSSGGTTGGGGGGGGGQSIIVINETKNATISNCNFNGICEGKNGEDPLGCPTDCKVNANYLTCSDPEQKCIKDIFNVTNAALRFSVVAVILASMIVLIPEERLRKLFKGQKRRIF